VAATPSVAAIVAAALNPAVLQASTNNPPVRQSSLILPGETPLQALRRRLAALDVEKAAKAAGAEQPGPRIARDDI